MGATVLALFLIPCLVQALQMELGTEKLASPIHAQPIRRHSRVSLDAWDGTPWLVTDATDVESNWRCLSAWQNVSSFMVSMSDLPCARFETLHTNASDGTTETSGYVEVDSAPLSGETLLAQRDVNNMLTEDALRGQSGIVFMSDDCEEGLRPMKTFEGLGFFRRPYFFDPTRYVRTGHTMVHACGGGGPWVCLGCFRWVDLPACPYSYSQGFVSSGGVCWDFWEQMPWSSLTIIAPVDLTRAFVPRNPSNPTRRNKPLTTPR